MTDMSWSPRKLVLLLLLQQQAAFASRVLGRNDETNCPSSKSRVAIYGHHLDGNSIDIMPWTEADRRGEEMRLVSICKIDHVDE